MKFLKGLGIVIAGAIGAVLGALLIAGLMFLQAVGAVALGWLSGVFIDWVFGGYVLDGINALLHAKFANLPQFTAVLWFIGWLINKKELGFKFNKNKEAKTKK
jgi:hypothetical protein